MATISVPTTMFIFRAPSRRACLYEGVPRLAPCLAIRCLVRPTGPEGQTHRGAPPIEVSAESRIAKRCCGYANKNRQRVPRMASAWLSDRVHCRDRRKGYCMHGRPCAHTHTHPHPYPQSHPHPHPHPHPHHNRRAPRCRRGASVGNNRRCRAEARADRHPWGKPRTTIDDGQHKGTTVLDPACNSPMDRCAMSRKA